MSLVILVCAAATWGPATCEAWSPTIGREEVFSLTSTTPWTANGASYGKEHPLGVAVYFFPSGSAQQLLRDPETGAVLELSTVPGLTGCNTLAVSAIYNKAYCTQAGSPTNVLIFDLNTNGSFITPEINRTALFSFNTLANIGLSKDEKFLVATSDPGAVLVSFLLDSSGSIVSQVFFNQYPGIHGLFTFAWHPSGAYLYSGIRGDNDALGAVAFNQMDGTFETTFFQTISNERVAVGIGVKSLGDLVFVGSYYSNEVVMFRSNSTGWITEIDRGNTTSQRNLWSLFGFSNTNLTLFYGSGAESCCLTLNWLNIDAAAGRFTSSGFADYTGDPYFGVVAAPFPTGDSRTWFYAVSSASAEVATYTIAPSPSGSPSGSLSSSPSGSLSSSPSGSLSSSPSGSLSSSPSGSLSGSPSRSPRRFVPPLPSSARPPAKGTTTRHHHRSTTSTGSTTGHRRHSTSTTQLSSGTRATDSFLLWKLFNLVFLWFQF